MGSKHPRADCPPCYWIPGLSHSASFTRVLRTELGSPWPSAGTIPTEPSPQPHRQCLIGFFVSLFNGLSSIHFWILILGWSTVGKDFLQFSSGLSLLFAFSLHVVSFVDCCPYLLSNWGPIYKVFTYASILECFPCFLLQQSQEVFDPLGVHYCAGWERRNWFHSQPIQFSQHPNRLSSL